MHVIGYIVNDSFMYFFIFTLSFFYQDAITQPSSENERLLIMQYFI